MKKNIQILVMAMLCPFKEERSTSLQTKFKTELLIKTLAQLALEELKLEKLLRRTKNYALTFLLLCIVTTLKGQEKSNVVALNIGDKVPDSFWAQKHIFFTDGRQINQSLSAYKGKLLIIDFWATWCSACITSITKMDSLKKTFDEGVILLPVTYQEHREIESFNKKEVLPKQMKLKSIINDSYLKQFFPHLIKPHLVIIDPNGFVRSISSTTGVTAASIEDILKGKFEQKWSKNDFNFQNPLIKINEAGGIYKDKKLLYTVITRYKEGLLPIIGERLDTLNGTVRTYLLNQSIHSLFNNLGIPRYLPENRFIYETGSKKEFKHSITDDFIEDWIRNHTYCVESILPIHVDKLHRNAIIKRQLNDFLGIDGRPEERETECWIITEEDYDKNRSINYHNSGYGEPGFNFRSVALNQLVWQMNNRLGSLPILLEAKNRWINIEGEISEISDFNSLQIKLKPHGLAIAKERRKIEFFVFSPATD